MFKDARKAAGLSIESAASILHIGTRTLVNYENNHSLTPPDIALKMSAVYGRPSLYAKYCSGYCPIGQRHAKKVEEKDLAVSVMGLLKEYNDIGVIKNRLIEIAADGIIDDEEANDFRVIVNELSELEQQIFNLKLWAASRLDVTCIEKYRKIEKTPVGMAAEPRVNFNF